MKKSHLSLVLLILGAGIFLYTQGRSLDKEIEFEQVPQKQSIDVSSFDSVDVDVPYSLDGDPAQTMDIYYPDEAKPYKVIVLIHGGNSFGGDKRTISLEPIIREMVEDGYAVASIDYRSPDKATWPAQLYDAKAAIRYIRENGMLYDLDTERIVVWGTSTGAHLALMLGATNENPEYEDLKMGNSKVSSSVQGVVSWFGLSDLVDFPVGADAANEVIGFDIQELLVRDSLALVDGKMSAPRYEEWLETLKNASPIYMVTEAFPPTLLVHGTDDEVIPCKQSILMYREINRRCNDNRATLRILKKAGHDSPVFLDKENILEDIAWVDQINFPQGRRR